MARAALAIVALGVFVCVNSGPAVKYSTATSTQSSIENYMEDISVIPIHKNAMSNEDQTSLFDEYNKQEAFSYDEYENIGNNVDNDEDEKNLHDKKSHAKGGLYFNYFEKINIYADSKIPNSSDDTYNDNIEHNNLNSNKENTETVTIPKGNITEHNTEAEDIDSSNAERTNEKVDNKNYIICCDKDTTDEIENVKPEKSNNTNEQNNIKHNTKKVDYERDNISDWIDKNGNNNIKATTDNPTSNNGSIYNYQRKTFVEDRNKRGDISDDNLDTNNKMVNVNTKNVYNAPSYWDTTESNSNVQATSYKPSRNKENDCVPSNAQKHERPYWDTNKLEYVIKSIKNSSENEDIIGANKPQYRKTSDRNHDDNYSPPARNYHQSDNNGNDRKDQSTSLGDISSLLEDQSDKNPFYGEENGEHFSGKTNFRNSDRSYKSIAENDEITDTIHNTQLYWEPIIQHYSEEDKKYDANNPINVNNFKRPYWESFSKNKLRNDKPMKDSEEDSQYDEKDHNSKNTNNHREYQKGRPYENHSQNTRKRTDCNNKEGEKYEDTNSKGTGDSRENGNHDRSSFENKNYKYQHGHRNWRTYDNGNWKEGGFNNNKRPYKSDYYNRGKFGTKDKHDVHYGKNETGESRRHTYRNYNRNGERNKNQSNGNRHHGTLNNSDRSTYHNRYGYNRQDTRSGNNYHNGNNNDHNHHHGARNGNNYNKGKSEYNNRHQGAKNNNNYGNSKTGNYNHHQGAGNYNKYDNNNKNNDYNHRQGDRNYNYDNNNKKVFNKHYSGARNGSNYDNSNRDNYNHHQEGRSNHRNDKRDYYSHQKLSDNYRYHKDGKNNN